MDSLGTFGSLTIGLVFGLKHATELDHVVAVSSIVSRHRSLLGSALVGGLWGLGHTASLLTVGLLVLVLKIAIPLSLASWLEFGVALMIIALGVSALLRSFRRQTNVHAHQHSHDGQAHVHIHFHDEPTEHKEKVPSHSHDIARVGIKPFLVGAVHGLAGSAALTILVLTQIPSVWLGIGYLALFGMGSIAGMLVMSSLIGLPFVLTGRRLSGVNYGLQAAAGCLSIAFGLWYAYETGVMDRFGEFIRLGFG